MVLIFATERKNNVDPRARSQKVFFLQVTGVHLMCQIFMNDLLTEQGQQRSRAIRYIVDTTQRSPANRNQIKLITLELSDLGHRIGSFSNTQYFLK